MAKIKVRATPLLEAIAKGYQPEVGDVYLDASGESVTFAMGYSDNAYIVTNSSGKFLKKSHKHLSIKT